MRVNWIRKTELTEHPTLIITCGIDCGDKCNCHHYKECKYKSSYKFHNFSVGVHRFFEYKLHIKLPRLPIYINREWMRLSGTEKCPFNMPRKYTCYDCEYVGEYMFEDCTCKGRNDTPYKEQKRNAPDIWHKYGQCGYFKKCVWADDWKDEVKHK